jgi:regulator of protease activity HflC (stomatin/prohibitin superfamily)
MMLVAAFMPFMAACFSMVDATEHCVETRYGKVLNEKTGNGLVSTNTTHLTCFPTIQQQFPGGHLTNGEAASEHIEFLTRDSVMVGVDFALNWDYKDPYQAFLTRRSHEAVLSELSNAMRSGAREAGATIGLPDFFGAKRAGMDVIFQEAFNRQMSKYAEIKKVYINHVTLPKTIQDAWLATQTSQAQQKQAIAAFITDSLNARRTVVTAAAGAEKMRLENQAMAVSPAVIQLRIAETMANGMARVCSGAQTCILGGSVMDTWKNKP